MPTRPQIMPLMAPKNVGFFCFVNHQSMNTQVKRPTAVATLVLSTAEAASTPA